MTDQQKTYTRKNFGTSACGYYEDLEEARCRYRGAIDQALQGMDSGGALAKLLLPELYRAATDKLCRVGVAKARAKVLAEDIAHDVFIELFKKDAKVLRRWTVKSCKGHPVGYFRLIAKRRAIDAWKKNRKMTLVDDLDVLSKPPVAPNMERALSARSCFHKTLGTRRDADGAADIAYDVLVAGVSQAALADDLGISPSAIYQRTKRFRTDFLKAWHEDEELN